MPVVREGLPVDRDWFARDSLAVAPELLGARLTHHTAAGDVSVRLTEVEAYRGLDDPGSHAFRGPTPRTRVMFGSPGHAYVYFTYGMHTMLNIVTQAEGTAAAVLLRAGEVYAGVELASSRRRQCPPRDVARGPARLAQALGVQLDESGVDLLGAGPFTLELPVEALDFVRTARTGVSGPGGADVFDWRFAALDSDGSVRSSVSRYVRHPKSH